MLHGIGSGEGLTTLHHGNPLLTDVRERAVKPESNYSWSSSFISTFFREINRAHRSLRRKHSQLHKAPPLKEPTPSPRATLGTTPATLDEPLGYTFKPHPSHSNDQMLDTLSILPHPKAKAEITLKGIRTSTAGQCSRGPVVISGSLICLSPAAVGTYFLPLMPQWKGRNQLPLSSKYGRTTMRNVKRLSGPEKLHARYTNHSYLM